MWEIPVEELPPFSGDADCPKCGGPVDVLYHHFYGTGFPCDAAIRAGHLCRVCRRCKYGWCEAPIDVKPAREHPRPSVACSPSGNRHLTVLDGEQGHDGG